MDPELLKQKAAFKERSMAVPVVEKKRAVVKPSSEPRKKKKSKLKRPKPQPVVTEEMKNSVLVGPRSNMPYRVLKAVVDMMGRRYAAKDYQSLSLEEILTGLKLTELRTDTRQWLSQVQTLKVNPKIKYYSAEDKYLFKPTLGLEVRNRRQLLARLKEYDKEGLGGILMSEIREALPHPDKAMSRLLQEDQVMKIVRPDKEEVVFFNNTSLRLPMAEEFRALWHCVSVDGLTEADIDKYLQSIGLGAMQGEARKRRAPTAGQKTKKKSRVTKVLNTHLDSTFLKDYSETQPKTS